MCQKAPKQGGPGALAVPPPHRQHRQFFKSPFSSIGGAGTANSFYWRCQHRQARMSAGQHLVVSENAFLVSRKSLSLFQKSITVYHHLRLAGWRCADCTTRKIGGAAPVWVLWRCHRHTASTANLFISGTANLAVLAPPTVETWRCHRHRQHRLGGVAVPVGLASRSHADQMTRTQEKHEGGSPKRVPILGSRDLGK